MSRIVFRNCDPRFGFLWLSSRQPPARWHAQGEGPANYFADTPTGAWAEIIRHEGITDPEDLKGLRRDMWAVEIPADGFATPALPEATLTGGNDTYGACQMEARRLRAEGAARLQVHGAALLSGAASGWVATATGTTPAPRQRNGMVCVIYGAAPLVGWRAAEAGSPPREVLALVRPL